MSVKLLKVGRAALVAAAICVATVPSPSLAATAPDFVTNEAVFWLDASTLSQLPGQEVTSWPDVRGEGHPVASTAPNRVNPTMTAIASGSLAGKVAVDFGSLGSNKDMAFDAALENVKMIFFVMDIDNAKYACLIGGGGSGSSSQRFCREKQAAYAANSGQTSSYSIWTNGEKVANPLNTATPSGYNLITYRYDGTSGFPCVGYLASDRNINGRVGGKRLCEVIGFTRVLSDSERVAVEGYLRAKWFEETWNWADDVPADDLLGMAQVHFDASVASSFHYDTEDTTKVVQWDDLSGNNNNFTPNTVLGTYYGTVSTVADKPVFDSGAAGSGIDLALATRLVDTRTVFMVADVERNGAVFWLGDSTEFRFHRGGGGQYTHSHGSVYARTGNGGKIWCNGTAVSNSDSEYPENPGALSIYTFVPGNACAWCRLGQDRGDGGRNGGKRVAELITFNFEMPDSARKHIEDYLFEKWTPSEAYIDSIAAVHVDASSASNFNYTDANITGWKNSASGNDLVASSTYGSCGYTNGVTAFLMGRTGSGIDMTFDRLTNIRAVFWAMDIQYGVQEAFFLGCTEGNIFHFHRGNSDNLGSVVGAYFSNNSNALAKNGTMYCDGERVAGSTTEKPPHGMHVFDLASSADLTASSLSNDRNMTERNGGRALSELLILTNEVWGLTRAGVRRRMESKWTRKCGWAGAGDAEWGAGKYRVFDSDAVVPADGAAAVGVGFTARATLSGGTLTLGDGGLFASEGVAATVSAPVAGKLGAYGLGTVNIATAPSTVDAISVGYGSTLVIAAGDTAISGGLSIQEKGKVVIDVSALAAIRHVAVTFASCVLPAGGTLLDYVSLTGNTAGHVLTIGTDGLSIHVNDPSIALSAEWNGGMNDSATVAANWRCRNVNGEELPNTTLPCVHTTNVVLNGDCDLRAWGTPVFADGVRIDLNGHVLRVASLADADFANAVITNSNVGAIAELRVDVAEGTRMVNSSVSILGGVKLVKDGDGTFVAACESQAYTGGTEVADGTLALGTNKYPLGAKNASVKICAGAVYDMAGCYNTASCIYAYDLAGTFRSKTTVSGGGYNTAIRILGSTFAVSGDDARLELGSVYFACPDATYATFTMNGHTLTFDGENYVGLGAFRSNDYGKWVFADGDCIYEWLNGYGPTNVDVEVHAPSVFKLQGDVDVKGLVYEGTSWQKNKFVAHLQVHGRYLAGPCHLPINMRSGSTLDLSAITGSFDLTNAVANTTAIVASGVVGDMTFQSGTAEAPSVINVNLAGKADLDAIGKSASPFVVTWTAAPTNVEFVLDAQSRANGYKIYPEAEGLRLKCFMGLMLLVR